MYKQNKKFKETNLNNLSGLTEQKELVQWKVVGPEGSQMIWESEENHNLKSDILLRSIMKTWQVFVTYFRSVFLLLSKYFKNTAVQS